MITCPNCSHRNPDGVAQCEECYTPLPNPLICPNCGAHTQTDAIFCGQCGTRLNGDAVDRAIAELGGGTSDRTSAMASASQPVSGSRAYLQHTQTNTIIELPQGLSTIHIGKPNDRIPPDIDVSGFPYSEVVSRIHANICVEGEAYYIEDAGSSNGTYINNLPLASGNRYRLRSGDRIALGKEDRVSFLFQIGP